MATGYSELIASHATDPAHEVRLPGLSRPLQISNFPSYLIDMSGSERAKAFIEVSQEFFQYLGQGQPKVLVNTLDELEQNALAEMRRHLEVFTFGPIVGSSTEARIHLFKHDNSGKKRRGTWSGFRVTRRSPWCTCHLGAYQSTPSIRWTRSLEGCNNVGGHTC